MICLPFYRTVLPHCEELMQITYTPTIDLRGEP
jgi:hypothetical protein